MTCSLSSFRFDLVQQWWTNKENSHHLIIAYNSSQFIVSFNLLGGGNDWKLSYKTPHHGVVEAFLSLFILIMNLVFWVINSLGPIAFSELSNIGNSIVISVFSGIINLTSTVFNIIKWLLKAEMGWVREVCVLSSFHPNPTLPTEMLTLVFCIIYTYAGLTSLYCLHLWQKCFLSLCLYTFFSSLIITPSFVYLKTVHSSLIYS